LKYLADGREVEVIQELESGYLVQYYYTVGGSDAGEYGLYLDCVNTQIVDRVFDTPPVAKFHESIAELNSQIEKIEETKSAKFAELKEVSKAIDDASTKRRQHEQLRLLDDFIAGKITHYVEFWTYGAPKIIEFQDAICNYDKKRLKLLTLFGDSKGCLEWKLSSYSDGSGGSSTVIPATSYEQAVEVARAHVVELLENSVDSPSQFCVDTADKWEVPVSDDYRQQAKSEERNRLTKALEERKGQVVAIESQLAQLG
jgi:hypothetical protein